MQFVIFTTLSIKKLISFKKNQIVNCILFPLSFILRVTKISRKIKSFYPKGYIACFMPLKIRVAIIFLNDLFYLNSAKDQLYK